MLRFTFCAAKGDVHERRLPGHEAGQAAHIIKVHLPAQTVAARQGNMKCASGGGACSSVIVACVHTQHGKVGAALRICRASAPVGGTADRPCMGPGCRSSGLAC